MRFRLLFHTRLGGRASTQRDYQRYQPHDTSSYRPQYRWRNAARPLVAVHAGVLVGVLGAGLDAFCGFPGFLLGLF